MNDPTSLDPTRTSNAVDLCISCKQALPECGAENIIFGTGLSGYDNIAACASYEPLMLKCKDVKVNATDLVEMFICRLIDNCEGTTITEEFLQAEYAELLRTLAKPKAK